MKKYMWILEIPMKVRNVKTGKVEEFKIINVSWHYVPQPSSTIPEEYRKKKK